MKYRGFTLIELLIVVALVGLLLLVALPFTGSWVNESRVKNNADLLAYAFSQAKAEAMRNGGAIDGQRPAAAVCYDAVTKKLAVKIPQNNESAACFPVNQSVEVWSAELFSSSVLKRDNNTDFSCQCFDNRGVASEKDQCNRAKCRIPNHIDISVGGEAYEFTAL